MQYILKYNESAFGLKTDPVLKFTGQNQVLPEIFTVRGVLSTDTKLSQTNLYINNRKDKSFAIKLIPSQDGMKTPFGLVGDSKDELLNLVDEFMGQRVVAKGMTINRTQPTIANPLIVLSIEYEKNPSEYQD